MVVVEQSPLKEPPFEKVESTGLLGVIADFDNEIVSCIVHCPIKFKLSFFKFRVICMAASFVISKKFSSLATINYSSRG